MPESVFPERHDKASAANSRLMSLDVLRGFDMAWLLGADALFAALFAASGFGVFAALDAQMHHADWHGFRFYDLIFPLFIFISGVALGLQGERLKSMPAAAFYRKQLGRFVLLVALGVVYNHGWGVGIPADFSAIRFASVLSRIACAVLLAAIVMYHFAFKQQLIIGVVVLLLYSLIQMAFPLNASHSINAYVDQHFLPGATWRHLPYDPEGLYGHLAAAVNALIGGWIGRHWTRWFASRRGMLRLLLAALLALVFAALLHQIYPINKSLWTGSFVIVTAACSTLLLLLFHLVFDRGHWPRTAHFFRVIGVNAILAYLGTSIVNWAFTTQTIFKWWIAELPGSWPQVASIVLAFSLQWLLLYWLDRKQAYLKI